MYVNSPFAKVPPRNAILWRYLDFAKYISLLDTGSIFFPRADKLNDPFEGSLPRSFASNEPRFFDTKVPLQVEEKAQFSDLPKFSLVSCWHLSTRESDAMWKLYSRETDGVAIRTEFKRLCDSLTSNNPDAQFFTGLVDYVDFATLDTPIRGSVDSFMLKRLGFEHERELRVLTQPKPEMDGYPGKPDLSAPLYEKGKSYRVDLEDVIQGVVVAPFAEDWFFDLVVSVTKRYGISVRVRRSELAKMPIWSDENEQASNWYAQ